MDLYFNEDFLSKIERARNTPTPLSTPQTNQIMQERASGQLQSNVGAQLLPLENKYSGLDRFEGMPSYELNDAELWRAKQQPWYEQTAAAVGQAVVGEIVGGTMMSVGALVEIPDMLYNYLTGEKNDWDNAIFSLGKSISDFSREEMPIYQTGERFSDPGWYMQGFTSAASALGMMAPGIGTAKLVGMLTKGLSKTMAGMITTGLSAGAMRHAENFREAAELYNHFENTLTPQELDNIASKYKPAMEKELADMGVIFDPENPSAANEQNLLAQEQVREKYQQLIQKDIEKAKSLAAAQAYNSNWINYAFDVIQMASILRPLKGMTRTTATSKVLAANDALVSTNKMLPKGRLARTAKAIWDPAKVGLSEWTEGIEEVINEISSIEGTRSAKIELGAIQDDGTTLVDRVGKYLGDEQVQDAFIWGLVGGVGFKMFARAAGFDEGKNITQSKLAEIASRAQTMQGYNETINAIKSGSKLTAEDGTVIEDFTGINEETKEARLEDIASKMTIDMASRAASTGNMELYLNWLKDPKTAQSFVEMGVIEAKDVPTKINELVQTAEMVEKTYQKNFNALFESPISETAKSILVKQNVALEAQLYNFQNKKEKLERDFIEITQKDPVHKQLANDENYAQSVEFLAAVFAETLLREQLKTVDKESFIYKTIEDALSNIEKTKKSIESIRLNGNAVMNSALLNNLASRLILEIYSKGVTNELSRRGDKKVIKEEAQKIDNEIKDLKDSIKEAATQADKQDKEDRIQDKKLQKELKSLARKVATATDKTEYSPEELQLQSNYAKEVENYIQELQSKTKNTLSNIDTNEKHFYKQLNSISDESFFNVFEETKKNIVQTITNTIEYLKDTSLSRDEKASLGEILKREHRKLRILEDKFSKTSYNEKSTISMEEFSETTKRNREQERLNIQQERLNEILINEVVDNISEDGREFIIRGKKYYNLYSFSETPTGTPGAINRNKEGYIISVTLTDENGKSVTFREEKIVDAVSYIILLQEIAEYENRTSIELDTDKINNIIEDNKSVDLKTKLSVLQQDLYEIEETLEYIDSEIKQTKYEYKKIGYSVSDALQDPKIITLLEQKNSLNKVRDVVISKISSLTNNTNEKEQVKAVRRKTVTRDKKDVGRKIFKRKEPDSTSANSAVQSVKTVEPSFSEGTSTQGTETFTESSTKNSIIEETKEEKESQEEITSEDLSKTTTDEEYVDDDKAKEIRESAKDVKQDLKNKNGSAKETDNGNIFYENFKITDGHNSLGHQDRAYKRTESKGVISYTNETNELNEDAPKALLDKDKFAVGTEVEFVVDDTDDTTIYDPRKTDKSTTTWGEYKQWLRDNNKGIEINALSEYINNVPIRLTKNGERYNALLHSTSWINEENILTNIEKDRTNLENIRRGIVAKGSFKTKVNSRTNGVLFTLAKDARHTLKQAVGEDKNYQIGVYGSDGMRVAPTVFAENLINDIRFLQKGATYLIVDTLNGKVAIPIDRDRAGEDVARIVTKAIEAYLDNDVAFRDEVLKITGDDITDPIGLRTFINRYVHVVNTGKNSLNNLITKGVFKTGSKNRYLTVLSNGTVEVYDGTVTGRVRFTSPTNQKQRKLLVDSIRKSLPNFYLNTNIKALSENSTLPFLDSEGKIVQRDYKDYLLETATTDVKGNEIGDGKYAYMIQPVYRFDFSEFTNPIKEKPTTPTESAPTKPEVSEEEYKKMLNAFEEFDLPYVGQVKPGVPELFESNPELANSVYEALGFGQENNTETKKADIERRRQDHLNRANSGSEVLYKYVPNGNNRPLTENEIAEAEGLIQDFIETGNKDVDALFNLLANQGYVRSTGSSVHMKSWLKDRITGELNTPVSSTYRMRSDINAKYDAELAKLNNQITPEQKQQAQQVYSDFLDKFVKRNFDKLVSEMESKNLIEKKCN